MTTAAIRLGAILLCVSAGAGCREDGGCIGDADCPAKGEICVGVGGLIVVGGCENRCLSSSGSGLGDQCISDDDCDSGLCDNDREDASCACVNAPMTGPQTCNDFAQGTVDFLQCAFDSNSGTCVFYADFFGDDRERSCGEHCQTIVGGSCVSSVNELSETGDDRCAPDGAIDDCEEDFSSVICTCTL